MSKGSTGSTSLAWRAAMLASFAAVVAYLLYRNLGLGPAIFADEWYYSKMSRLLPLSEATLPSYLYFWLMRSSTACGQGFLDCVRVGNALLFVGAGPFIYLCAREFTERRVAWLVALLAVLAPVNLHTLFFMPESTYYFGFWVLTWIVLTKSADWSWPWRAAIGGTLLGLLSLVKVHALFLLPALCLFLLYVQRTHGARWGEALLAMLLAALACLAVKFGLGYLLAGDSALSLTGSFYAGAKDESAKRSALSLLQSAFINGRAHLMALAVLLGTPLAVLAYSLAGRPGRGRGGDRLDDLHVYTALMLAAALGMTVAFTASVAHTAPDEGLRLHMRYYNFMFPLLFIVVAATPRGDGHGRNWRGVVALPMAVLIGLAIWKLPLYSIRMMDGPEIASVGLRPRYGALLVALQLLALLLWARRSRWAVPVFLLAALPLLVAYGLYASWAYTRQLVTPWAGDKAGRFAYSHVPKAEHKLVTVAGDNLAMTMRAVFHIDDKDVVILQLPKGAPIASYNLPVYKKWLLVVGPHALPPGVQAVEANRDFALVKVNEGTRSLGISRLSRPFGEGPLASADGLSPMEPWGRWSDGKQVVFHFKQPLPRHLSVLLKAHAFGPNAGLPFRLRAGDQEVEFRLGQLEQDIGLQIETDGRQRSLTIEVPRPTSPAELGLAPDARTLGIGIMSIEIGSVDKG